jgi:alanyl-tRNA synthetase
MRKKIESMEMKQAAALKTELLNELVRTGKYEFTGKRCEGIGPDALRKLAGELRQEHPDLLIVLSLITDGKPFVVVGIGDQLVKDKNLDASVIIRESVAPLIKGGGGGQKTLASAGGLDAGALEKVFSSVKAVIG